MQRYFLITCDQGEGLAVEEYSREGIEAVLDEITDGVKILEELPTAWQTWLNAYRRSEQDGQPVVVIRGEVVVPQAQERAVMMGVTDTAGPGCPTGARACGEVEDCTHVVCP